MAYLTEKQYDVLIRLAKEDKKIAEELNMSINTVKFYYKQLAKMFNVNTRSAIIVKSARLGFVDIDAFEL